MILWIFWDMMRKKNILMKRKSRSFSPRLLLFLVTKKCLTLRVKILVTTSLRGWLVLALVAPHALRVRPNLLLIIAWRVRGTQHKTQHHDRVSNHFCFCYIKGCKFFVQRILEFLDVFVSLEIECFPMFCWLYSSNRL